MCKCGALSYIPNSMPVVSVLLTSDDGNALEDSKNTLVAYSNTWL